MIVSLQDEKAVQAGSSRTSRKRRKFWEDHVSRWRVEGLSQAEYCRIHGLSIQSFGYHERSLGDSVASFVEVARALPAPILAKPIEVRVGERYAILVEPGFDAETLHRLIEVLDR